MERIARIKPLVDLQQLEFLRVLPGSDLDQFLRYIYLRTSLSALSFALTHPALEGAVPFHLLARIASDCFFLGKHPDVQKKINRQIRNNSEAERVPRFDKYFAGFIAGDPLLLCLRFFLRLFRFFFRFLLLFLCSNKCTAHGDVHLFAQIKSTKLNPFN